MIPPAVQAEIDAVRVERPGCAYQCERIAALAVRETARECIAICEATANETDPEDFALDAVRNAANTIRARYGETP